MNKTSLISALGACLVLAATCSAFDTVKLADGTTARGSIVSMSPAKVILSQPGGIRKEIDVCDILTIYFDSEPATLRLIRSYVRDGQYEDAIEALDRLNPSDLGRAAIKQDVDYFKAYCQTKLALGGTGKPLNAARTMKAFLDKNPASYHYLEATELMGNLALAMGQYDTAEALYTKVARAPWPDYKMRAAVAMGYCRLAQNKVQPARQAFNLALQTQGGGAMAQQQKLAARLGIARCDAVSDPQKAIATAQQILNKADPNDFPLIAKAYNTIGTAYRKAGKTKPALLAFLHVDILFNHDPEAHAEALKNLEALWKESHKPDRALYARRLLDGQYKNSRWAK